MSQTKICLSCSAEFQVPPSRAQIAKYCSPECSQAASIGKPRIYTPESRARLTGRPKLAPDVERTCPTCEASFTRPAHDKAIYCSRACFSARPDKSRKLDKRIEKTCPICNSSFKVFPSRSGTMCCSRACLNKHLFTGKARTLKAKPSRARTMTETECAWLAGLFDGEGSIMLTARKRAGGGTVRITIVNTVRALIDRVEEVTGIGTSRVWVSTNPRHADAWTWGTHAATALHLLEQMRPWLIVKAERADMVLAGEVFPRQARWDDIYPEVVGAN